MKNIQISIAALLLAAGIVSCTSCASKHLEPVVPVPVPVPVVVADAGSSDASDAAPVDAAVAVKRDNYEFTLPNSGWTTIEGANNTTEAGYVNQDKKNLILSTKEKFPGTSAQYALISLREIKETGAKIVAATQMTIDSKKFAAVESTKDNARVYNFTTTFSGFGYSFTCDGVDDGTQHDLCVGIVNTLKIK